MEFNIVFHGMMLFVEQGAECLVLMPEIKEHDFRFGDPTVAKPRNLWPGEYRVTGIDPREDYDQFKDHADEYLVLKPSVGTIPRLKRVAVRMPLPDEILVFRPVKPDTVRFQKKVPGPADIFNGTPQDIAVAVPTNLNDAIVFNYQDVDPTDVALKLRHGSVMWRGSVKQGTTLCLYAQTGWDIVALNKAADADNDPPPGGNMPHRTGVNDLVHFASGTSQSHPEFELSLIGVADGPPGYLPHNLERAHMLNLTELSPLLTDESGCVGAAISGD